MKTRIWIVSLIAIIILIAALWFITSSRESAHASTETGGSTEGSLAPQIEYQFQGEILRPDGTLYTETVQLLMLRLDPFPSILTYDSVYPSNGQFDTVLDEGLYVALFEEHPHPFVLPRTIVDLRGPVTDFTINLVDHYEYTPEQTPPDASLISVSPPDVDGYATVSGAPGAVPPYSAVAVANLSASPMAATLSDGLGAFTTTALYAPPGSSLLIKYDPESYRAIRLWEAATSALFDDFPAYANVLPGTIIHAGGAPPRNGATQAFSVVGGFWQMSPKSWAGWWLTGTLQTPAFNPVLGLKVTPGGTVTVTANLRITSPGLGCTQPPTYSVSSFLNLHQSFGVDGRADPWGMGNNAFLFTPTGLPIDCGGYGDNNDVAAALIESWTCASVNSFDASFTLTFTVSPTQTEGSYLPEANFQNHNVPLTTTHRIIPAWYNNSSAGYLPKITIGDPAPPHIPWVLLADYPVNGHRGLQAREDEGYYQLYPWIIIPQEEVAVPRIDERAGDALVYRLEPGTNWLSATDRRLPNPPHIPFDLPSGHLTIEILGPDYSVDQLGPATILQSSLRSPTTPGGVEIISQRSGRLDDIYHLTTMSDTFSYSFDQYGSHQISLLGEVDDIYGNTYLINSTYDVHVAQLLDLDPAQLPTMPYVQGDVFAPGLHIYPPFPADVTVQLVQMPYSDPAQAITSTVSGQANRFGYFQQPADSVITLTAPGEFRVDITASHTEPDGTMWMGSMTWGNVVEGPAPMIRAHGRRGLDYISEIIDEQPPWFDVNTIPPERKQGAVEVYYPYFSGDIHWGLETFQPGDSIHPIITIEDLGATGAYTGPVYNLLRANHPRGWTEYRRPPSGARTYSNLIKRMAIDEAPLTISTRTGVNGSVFPEEIDMWAYYYASSERPGVRVRENIAEDMIGVGYWGFDDTYNYQFGVPVDGDLPGDLKWEFGGAVLRTITETSPLTSPVALSEYAIYSSLWVLLPTDDARGARVTAPFRGAGELDGGPIMTITVQGQPTAIDMLFLPLGVRPGDVLEVGDVIAFSGMVGPPVDSRVSVTITSPSDTSHPAVLRANKIGWVYDPGFDFAALEPGRWMVDVHVLHDRVYEPTGGDPNNPLNPYYGHNTGTVLGTSGRYEFYVVEPGSPRLFLTAPQPGILTWLEGEIEPVQIQGYAPPGASAVYYTIYDKGTVMRQGSVTPEASGRFVITYDAEALNEDYPYVSLLSRDGKWEGLADEVSIGMLSVGGPEPRANTVTLIGEEVFITGSATNWVHLPLVLRDN
jgi:hypothetical protein